MKKLSIIALVAFSALCFAASAPAAISEPAQMSEMETALGAPQPEALSVLNYLGFETPGWMLSNDTTTNLSCCSICLRRCGATGGRCTLPPGCCACY